MSNNNDVVYEVKKEISVSNIMQLIDLNGSKTNFQSKFILETDEPTKKVSVCVVNQDELDNGKINFEDTERGRYSRVVTFQSDKHVNHYIALKKHPEDKEDKNVDCVLVIHMKELPPPPPRELDMPNLNPDMSDDTKEDIRKTLFKLRDNEKYNNMPDSQDIIPNIPIEVNRPKPVKKEEKSFMNSYFFVGIIFLCIFAYVFYTKKIKKS